jgi:probable H4MPT-linked C1 transfer pathway protein
MSWLAVDIGGANLKVADGRGFARSQPFALWQAPDQLANQVRALLEQAPTAGRLAVTMTGELADCFSTKSAGVRSILESVGQAGRGCQARVYLTDGRLVSLDAAREVPHLAAASNWHVMARYAGRFTASGPGLMIDVGSTTTDIIPLLDGQPAVSQPDDTSRLIAGQLVYTGVQRSPVCAVARAITYRGHPCPLAQELFATMRDVYLILGQLPEDLHDTDTADGRSATRRAAWFRLARSVCADAATFNQHDAVVAAESLADAQLEHVAAGITRVVRNMPQTPAAPVVCGQGEFLARRAAQQVCSGSKIVSLAERLGPLVSQCGPAHALATIAMELDPVD